MTKVPFGYYGGKTSHLPFILSHLPYKSTYLEPFGGSGAVLLARKVSKNEHYNDINSNWYAFFKALRDFPDELIRKCLLSPWSQQEWEESIKDDDDIDIVEQARRWYVNVTQAVNNRPYSGWARRYQRTGHLISSRRNTIEHKFTEIANRIGNVYIHKTDAIKIINRVYEKTGKDLVIYCDPPYPNDSLKSQDPYAFTMTEDEHRNLAETLHKLKCYVAISGYDSPLMKELYSDWHRWTSQEKRIGSSKEFATRTEVIWTNEVYRQPMMI